MTSRYLVWGIIGKQPYACRLIPDHLTWLSARRTPDEWTWNRKEGQGRSLVVLAGSYQEAISGWRQK